MLQCSQNFPGVLIDRQFLFLSTVVVLSLQLLLEYIRLNRIGFIADILEDSFKIFVDEKDSGKLILTNIYLLAGASLPLWLVQDLDRADPVLLLTGVISIGIGDSAASIVGSKFGRFKFPATDKTLEGTLASIVCQIIFVRALSSLNFWLLFSVTVVSVAEAFTTQVDNIVLPLLLYTLLTVQIS